MIPGDLLGERARLTPQKTALVYVPTGERLTYGELDARAVRLARVWREKLGLAKGDRFAIFADNRVEYLDAFFAAPKAGVVLVPLGTRLTPRELAYQRRGVAFKQGYGLTEVGVNCFAMTVEESVAKPGAIGKPMMFTETRLIGDDGAEVPAGEVGELLLRGPHVSRGYWNHPEATAAALDADGWFHTGDLARRDADGFHYIAGRKKDMIISGGVNVYPAEIEGELLLHPAVRDAAVVGILHPTWGEAGVAFVVPGDERPSPDDLAGFLGERLAKYKVPREFVFVESLPRTPYGKVVKGELWERYLAEQSK